MFFLIYFFIKEFSMTTNLLGKDCALSAIYVLTGCNFMNLDRKDAVIHIIEQTEADVRSEVATLAIDFCLSTLDESLKKPRLIKNFDLLSLALSISFTPDISHPTSLRLVGVAAQSGFHGCFPGLPVRLLRRSMNEDDINSLVSAYVNDRTSQSSNIEEKLASWASEYLQPDVAQSQIDRIKEFRKNWEVEIDL